MLRRNSDVRASLIALAFLGALLAAPASAQQSAPIPTESSPAPTAPAAAAGQGAPVPLPPLPPIEEEAYDRVKDTVAPLSPAQIREFNRVIDETEKAAATPARFVPKEVSSSVVVSLQPGVTPPVVRLFANHVTTVVFMDQVGNPLNIRAVDLGAPNSFQLTWQPKDDGTTSFFSLSPKSLYARGNVAVTLDGVPAPVTLTLVTGQREVDFRVDVRVRGVAIAGVSTSNGLPPEVDPINLAMLGGQAPDGATALTSDQPSVRAWSIGSRFFVRTPPAATLLSPAYTSVAKGPDGTAVYTIPPTPVVVVLSGQEQLFVKLSGY
jgi:intracellular multiplication protein IcmK